MGVILKCWHGTGIVETGFAEYLSGLTDVPATLETTESDTNGKVTLHLCQAALFGFTIHKSAAQHAHHSNFLCTIQTLVGPHAMLLHHCCCITDTIPWYMPKEGF